MAKFLKSNYFHLKFKYEILNLDIICYFLVNFLGINPKITPRSSSSTLGAEFSFYFLFFV